MKTDFEHWLTAQFGETGSFTLFILLMRISEMRALLDSAGTPWDGVAFFVGLGHAGGPLADDVARRKLAEVEADVQGDPLTLNRGRFFDREGRQLRIDEAAA
jgi:hypothetical protein